MCCKAAANGICIAIKSFFYPCYFPYLVVGSWQWGCMMLKQIVLLKKTILCLLVVVLTFLVMSSSALAQLPPPISPWMGMFDRTRYPGSISPYHQNVKPQQDMMRAYAAQSSLLQSQQQALRTLQSSSGGGGVGSGINPRDLTDTGIAGTGAPTKDMLLAPPREIPSMQRNPAGFNQYLHYYPPGSLPHQPVPNFSPASRSRVRNV